MGLETRLVRRPNGTYSFRAWVPPELREVVPGGRSGQKWIALGTSDRAEAVRRARLKSVEFDQQLETARRQLRGEEDVIPQAEAARLAAVWLSRELAEDEELRREGVPYEVLEEDRSGLRQAEALLRRALATGTMEGGDYGLAAFLESQGVLVRPGSESWKRVSYEFLKAYRKALVALQSRNEGEVVDTPALPSAASTPRSCTVEELITAYLADPTRSRTAGTLKTYQTVFRAMRELLGPDTPVDSVHRVDCERIRNVVMRLPRNA